MRLAGTNFLPSVTSGGICRTAQRPGKGEQGARGGSPLGPSAWSCPPLAAICPSGLPAPPSGWGATTVRMEEKQDSGSWGWGMRQCPGLSWVEEGSLGRGWPPRVGPSVKSALSFVWVGPPQIGHLYSGSFQLHGSGRFRARVWEPMADSILDGKRRQQFGAQKAVSGGCDSGSTRVQAPPRWLGGLLLTHAEAL